MVPILNPIDKDYYQAWSDAIDSIRLAATSGGLDYSGLANKDAFRKIMDEVFGELHTDPVYFYETACVPVGVDRVKYTNRLHQRGVKKTNRRRS